MQILQSYNSAIFTQTKLKIGAAVGDRKHLTKSEFKYKMSDGHQSLILNGYNSAKSKPSDLLKAHFNFKLRTNANLRKRYTYICQF